MGTFKAGDLVVIFKDMNGINAKKGSFGRVGNRELFYIPECKTPFLDIIWIKKVFDESGSIQMDGGYEPERFKKIKNERDALAYVV